jgi:hypothetical protein
MWGSANGPPSPEVEPGLDGQPMLELAENAIERARATRSDLVERLEPTLAPVPSVDQTGEQSTNGSADGDPDDDPPVQDVDAPPASLLTPRVEPDALTGRAVREVRKLTTALEQMRKGKALHHVVSNEGFGYLAQSFAGIYLLVLVFETSFDEVRAERATLDALPRIERLVLALPPLDPRPAPMANVVRLRRPRRR